MSPTPHFLTLFDELSWRGFVYQSTSEDLKTVLSEENLTMYIGFDPSAPSLHAGNMMGLMLLLHAKRHGHTVIPLLGGGTGLIGDPSLKSKERPLQSEDEVRAQGEKIAKQMFTFLSQVDGGSIQEANNLDWLSGCSLIEFLRDVGKHFSVNEMMRRDSVQLRFEGENAGISYTEFSYMLLQGYDFVELYRRYGCRLQCGGSDQWGNIVSGVDLLRRMEGVEGYGLTMPLLTNSEGKKYGKTEGGAVWMSAEMMSPYAFYQFWLNAADADTEKLLKLFTLLSPEEIEALVATIGSKDREAQKALAAAVTTLVHGEEETEKAIAASAALFSGSIAQLPVDTLLEISSDVPSCELSTDQIGISVIDLLVESGSCSSKSDARRAIEQGGVKVNGEVVDLERVVSQDDFREGKVLVLQRGKKWNGVVVLSQ